MRPAGRNESRSSLTQVQWLLALGLAGCMSSHRSPTGQVRLAFETENGLSANGLSANGLSANGLSANGLSANGLSANGLSANGLSANGLSANGLSANGLTDADLDSNILLAWGLGTNLGDNPDPARRQGLNALVRDATIAGSMTQLLLADPTAVSWTSADGVTHHDSWGHLRISVLQYLYKIAAAPYHTRTFVLCQQGVSGCTNDDGDPATFAVVTLGAGSDGNGNVDGHENLGLWPLWEDYEITFDPADPSGHSLRGEWVVSAAMAAHVNGYGRHVRVLLRGDHESFGSGLAWTANDLNRFPFVNGAFAANLWRTDSQGGPIALVSSGPYNSDSGIGFRACASSSGIEACGSLFHYRGILAASSDYETGSAGPGRNYYDFDTGVFNPPSNGTHVFDAFALSQDASSGDDVWLQATSTIAASSPVCGDPCVGDYMVPPRPATDFPVAIAENDCAPTRGTLLPGMHDMPCLRTATSDNPDPSPGFNDTGCCSGLCDHDPDPVNGGSDPTSGYYCQTKRWTVGGYCTSDDDCATHNCVASYGGSSGAAHCLCVAPGLSCRDNWECCSFNCAGGVCQPPPTACGNAYDACTSDGDCCSGHCVSGSCTSSNSANACGTDQHPCCSGDRCLDGMVCAPDINGFPTCYSCGAAGQPCCAGSTCNDGLSCNSYGSSDGQPTCNAMMTGYPRY